MNKNFKELGFGEGDLVRLVGNDKKVTLFIIKSSVEDSSKLYVTNTFDLYKNGCDGTWELVMSKNDFKIEQLDTNGFKTFKELGLSAGDIVQMNFVVGGYSEYGSPGSLYSIGVDDLTKDLFVIINEQRLTGYGAVWSKVVMKQDDTYKQMIEVINAHREGKTIQYRIKGEEYDFGWIKLKKNVVPDFNFQEYEYRILIEPDSINWEHVLDEYKFMARNEDGSVSLFMYKPEIYEDHWSDHLHWAPRAEIFKTYKKGDVDWKDSLVERPSK